MKYILLLLSCYTCFAQVGFGHFSDEPYLAGRLLSTSDIGDLFLWVDSFDVLGTNSPMQNGDVVTNVVDKGTNHWTTRVQNGPKTVMRYWKDGSSGDFPNGVPFIRETNNSSGVGVSGGFGVPAQWMSATDTNWSILLLCKTDPGGAQVMIYGEEGGSGGPSFYMYAFNGGPGIETHDVSSQGANGTFTSNVLYAITIIQSNAFIYVFTNNILTTGPVAGTPRAIGYFSSSSLPRFFGVVYTGTGFWGGNWARVMMWKYVIAANIRTNAYNRCKTDFSLTGILP